MTLHCPPPSFDWLLFHFFWLFDCNSLELLFRSALQPRVLEGTTALFAACKALYKPAFDDVTVEITSSILQLPIVHSLAMPIGVEALVVTD